jgi:tetratricopeptide (TPR) repeat protein
VTSPSRFDHFLDRVPVLGRFRRARGWFRRNRIWFYLAIAIAVLFVVRPVLTILATIMSPLAPLVGALVNNPVGRFVFYNLLGLLLLWWIWRKVRAGVLRVIGLRAMRSFLDGLTLMIHGRWDAAIGRFQDVVRWDRWVRLEDAVPEHRDLGPDTRLKIAACHLRRNRPNEAKAWLLRVREREILSEHVRRNHAELRALAYDLNDELERETVLKELERTHARDKGNRRILLALREQSEAMGDLERARAMGRRLVALSDGRDKEEAQSELALLEFRLARKALDEGDKRELKRALKATSGDPRSALLLGDLALEGDDIAGALKAWSRSVSLPVFDRLARLLEKGRLEGDREKELLLRHFPYAGTLIVLAEHYRKRGEHRKARAALDRVLASAGENLTVLRLYAGCLEAEGDARGAAELYRRALSSAL